MIENNVKSSIQNEGIDYRYTFELRRGVICVYDRDTLIAEICSKGNEAKRIANNMVHALNSRDRWFRKTGRTTE